MRWSRSADHAIPTGGLKASGSGPDSIPGSTYSPQEARWGFFCPDPALENCSER
jgi:hypothetical protein